MSEHLGYDTHDADAAAPAVPIRAKAREVEEIVRLTPPGSGCSISFIGKGVVPDMPPGSLQARSSWYA